MWVFKRWNFDQVDDFPAEHDLLNKLNEYCWFVQAESDDELCMLHIEIMGTEIVFLILAT